MAINKLRGGHEQYKRNGRVNYIRLRDEIFFVLRCFGRMTDKDTCNFFEDVVSLLKEVESENKKEATSKKVTPVKTSETVAKVSKAETAAKEKKDSNV